MSAASRQGKPPGIPMPDAFTGFDPTDTRQKSYRVSVNVPRELMAEIIPRLEAMHRSASWYFVQLALSDVAEASEDGTPTWFVPPADALPIELPTNGSHGAAA